MVKLIDKIIALINIVESFDKVLSVKVYFMCGSIIKGRTVKLIIQPYAYFSGGGGGGQEMSSPGAGGIGAGGAGGASSNSASGDSNSFYSSSTSTNTGQLGQPILEAEEEAVRMQAPTGVVIFVVPKSTSTITIG